jgi:hypothetical protein
LPCLRHINILSAFAWYEVAVRAVSGGREFVSDIFREVDEEVRRDQLKKLWERHGGYFIALAVLFVAAVAGWRGYQWWQAKQAAESGAAFTAALVLGEQGKHEEAETVLAKIARDGTASYRAFAALREAGELAQHDPKAAVVAYDALANNNAFGPVLQDLAVLRAGYLLVDTASYDEMRRRIEPLTGTDRTYRHSARALLALAAWRANDAAAARRWVELILADVESPATTRGQAEILMTMLGGDGKS